MTELVYPELSYKIMGILFEIHNELGNRYQEKYYQRAVEVKLKKQSISYQRELSVAIEIEGEKIGTYFLDFFIEKKVILELKAKPSFSKGDYNQVLGYLQAKKVKLGILANFYNERLEYKRILNANA